MSSPTIHKLYETKTQWCDKHQDGSEYIIYHPQHPSTSSSVTWDEEESGQAECERNRQVVSEFCTSCKTNFTPKNLSAFGDEMSSQLARRGGPRRDTRNGTHSQFGELTSPVFDRKLTSTNQTHGLLGKLGDRRRSLNAEDDTEINELRMSDENTDLCKQLWGENFLWVTLRTI